MTAQVSRIALAITILLALINSVVITYAVTHGKRESLGRVAPIIDIVVVGLAGGAYVITITTLRHNRRMVPNPELLDQVDRKMTRLATLTILSASCFILPALVFNGAIPRRSRTKFTSFLVRMTGATSYFNCTCNALIFLYTNVQARSWLAGCLASPYTA